MHPRGVVDCILLASLRMAAAAIGRILALLAFVIIVAPSARAQDPSPPPPHVRPETADLRALVAEASVRSPIVRTLVDRLERSDVTVYIRHRVFNDSLLEGRVGILSVVPGQRYLVIELACVRLRAEQMATLGHELYHAVEIAEEPSIVDARSLRAFYARVGMRIGGHGPGETFETSAARQAGLQVRRDVLTKAVRVAEE